MKENYLISVLGTQEIGGERDSVELTTTGDYYEKNSKRYIVYKEYDEENPQVSNLSTIEIDGDTVTVIKSGLYESRLILQKAVRHQCHYSTMFGDLSVGVYTDSLEDSLNDAGGELFVSYTLDFNAELVSKNEIQIKVKKKEVD